MDRPRESIEQDSKKICEIPSELLEMQNEQWKVLFLEVILDIRDDIRKIKQNLGESKWGSHL